MLVAQTAYAMSTEEARFILNGVLLVAKQGQLTLVATDGRRLAVASTPLSAKTPQEVSVVVPAKTIRELGRLLQDEDQTDVSIIPLKDNQLTFQFGHVTVVTRLIEGQFPQYDKVIPVPSKQRFTCNRPLLLNAIRRAGLMTTTTSQAVLFEVGLGRLVISKESSELGSVREELPIVYEGEPAKIAFNPEFWSDALKTLDTPEVTVELSGPERPAVVRQAGFLYLVLPMKLT
jgi:DNA polymerase-3 subunit beta